MPTTWLWVEVYSACLNLNYQTSQETLNQIHRMNSIPSVFTPDWWQLISTIFQPLEFLEQAAREKGDRFVMEFPGVAPLTVLSHPTDIAAVMSLGSQDFQCGPTNQIFRPLAGEHSLLVADGKAHQQQRRLITPPFHGDRLQLYGQLIQQITQQEIQKQGHGQPFSVRPTLETISLNVILQAVFGVNATNRRYVRLLQLLSEIQGLFGSPLMSTFLMVPALQQDWGPWSPWGRFLHLRQEADDLIYSEIQQRRGDHSSPSASDRTDILSLLLSAQDEAGNYMSDPEIRDQLMTLLVAGYETTTTALCWALYWIHSQSEVYKQLLDELSTLPPDADPSKITQLPYLSAVCQETLRIYPIALFTFVRILKQPLTLRDHCTVPSGTHLLPCIYLLHHRPDLYPEPNVFRPERFLGRQFSSSEYQPFGGGTRRCVGASLALFEMKIVLATLLRTVRLQLQSTDVHPTRRNLTLAPSDFSMRVVS